MNCLLTTMKVVLPLFLMIGTGFVLKEKKLLSEETAKQINKISFSTFIPLLVFNNIRNTRLEDVLNYRLFAFTVASILVMWGISIVIGVLTEKSPETRASMIQGMFRSNYTLYGLPVITLLVGSSNAGLSSFLITIIIPSFNILSIITLETFRNREIKLLSILISFAKNPLMIGAFAGLAALMLELKIPEFLEVTIEELAALAVPLALIVMGATFKFSNLKANRLQLALTVIMRLVIFPAVFMSIALLLGFRGIDIATLLAVFATPTAVVSYPMAQAMGCDGDFARDVVVLTTVLSGFTVFAFVFMIQYFGFISI